MRVMLFIFILPSVFSCYGQEQELSSPPCYTAEDNFYYLESSRERNQDRFRCGGDDRSGVQGYQGYYDPSFSGMSSYQGTTTGPGPNGGYPGSPRGSYNVNMDPSTRPHF